ncbi:MAG: tetratricopeptide repeat protein [Vicinamibacterales bacterium]
MDGPLIGLARLPGDELRALWTSIQILLQVADNPWVTRFRVPRATRADPRFRRDTIIVFTPDQQRRLQSLVERVRRRGIPLFLQRAIVAHTDVVVLAPDVAAAAYGTSYASDPIRMRVGDGQMDGAESVSLHGERARAVLTRLDDGPDATAFGRDWYRATLAFQQQFESFDSPHLRAALQAFPDDPGIRFMSGCQHEALAGPLFQAFARSYRHSGLRPDIDSSSRELAAAEREFRRALAADPAHTEARLHLGRVLSLRGRHQEGAAELEAAYTDTRDALLQYFAALFLGDAHEALGRLAVARSWYERAARATADARIPHLALARLARELGDDRAAEASLERALARPPVEGQPVEPWWAYRHTQARGAAAQLDALRLRVVQGGGPP